MVKSATSARKKNKNSRKPKLCIKGANSLKNESTKFFGNLAFNNS
jgi:hypothetical protein